MNNPEQWPGGYNNLDEWRYRFCQRSIQPEIREQPLNFTHLFRIFEAEYEALQAKASFAPQEIDQLRTIADELIAEVGEDKAFAFMVDYGSYDDVDDSLERAAEQYMEGWTEEDEFIATQLEPMWQANALSQEEIARQEDLAGPVCGTVVIYIPNTPSGLLFKL